MEQSGGNRRGAEKLKGASGGGARGLVCFGRGGGSKRLGGIIGDRGDLELGGTSRDA